MADKMNEIGDHDLKQLLHAQFVLGMYHVAKECKRFYLHMQAGEKDKAAEVYKTLMGKINKEAEGPAK